MSKKILVVDDSATIRESVSFIMTKAGFETLQAVDGIAALKKTAEKVDVIITDLNMPNMDGLTFIRQVRNSDGPNKYTPILMLTTEGDPAKKQEGKAAGATGWIVKPFNPDQLQAVVDKVMK